MAFVYAGTLNPSGGAPATAMEVDQSDDFDCLVYRSGNGELVGAEARATSVDDYLFCKVCKANFMTVKTAMVHYNGKPHQRTLTAIAENMGVLNVPTLDKDGKPQRPENQLVTATPRGGAMAGFVKPGQKRATYVEGRLTNGIFVDNTGCLWGPEKDAKTLGEFKTCKLCDVTASSFKVAKEHYHGTKHLKLLKKKATENGLKFRAVGKKLYTAIAQGPTEQDDDPLGVETFLENFVPSQSSNKRKVPEGMSVDEEVEWIDDSADGGEVIKKQKTTDDSDKYCDTCQITLSSKVVADLHYAGKKHAKNIEKLMMDDPKAGSGKYTLDFASSNEIPFCQPCDLMCLTFDQLEEHLAGEEHKAKVAEEKERFHESVKSVTADDPDYNYSYGCRICDVKVTSKDNYIEHMQSKKHLKKFNANQVKKEEERMKRMGGGGFRGGMRPAFGGPRPGLWGPPAPPLGWGGFGGGPMSRGRGGPNWRGDGPGFRNEGGPGWRNERGPGWKEEGGPGWKNEGPGWGNKGPGWGDKGGSGWRDEGPGGWGNEDNYADYEWKGSNKEKSGSSRGSGTFPYKDVRLEDEPYFGSEHRSGPPNRGSVRGGARGGGMVNRGGPSGRGGPAGRGGPSKGGPKGAGGGSGPMNPPRGSGEDLTSSILNMLPKEAVMKLAMEALSTKSKDIMEGQQSKGGQGGANWDSDTDYQSYNRQQEGGPKTQWGNGRGRGGRGFDGY